MINQCCWVIGNSSWFCNYRKNTMRIQNIKTLWGKALLYRTYIYIHRECRSVLVKLHPMTVYRTVFLGVPGSCVECHLLFSLVSPIVSCPTMIRLIQGFLWPLMLVLNNILTLGIFRSAISHPLGCFCPWNFFHKIAFNMVQSDPTSRYSSRIFCRGVLGFATDCPCAVCCCELTICLRYVGPLLGNRLLKNSWAVGLT